MPRCSGPRSRKSCSSRIADAEALDVAASAVRRTPAEDQVALAGYIAGLAAWRLDRPELARSYFEGAWHAPVAPSALRSAAAFWAARAYLRARDGAGYATWMERAAEERRSFYGLLARAVLGLGPGPGWERDRFWARRTSRRSRRPAPGKRAFALLQVGKPDLAEAELRRLWPASKEDPALARAVLLVGGAGRPHGPRRAAFRTGPEAGGTAAGRHAVSRCRGCTRAAGSASTRRSSMRSPGSN